MDRSEAQGHQEGRRHPGQEVRCGYTSPTRQKVNQARARTRQAALARKTSIPDQDQEDQIRGRIFRKSFFRQARPKANGASVQTFEENSGCSRFAERSCRASETGGG